MPTIAGAVTNKLSDYGQNAKVRENLIVVNSIIRISEPISRLFVITQIINETVQVAESIIKDLRDGLVRVRRSIRINKRGGSASLKGRSKTTRLSRKGSQEVNDRSKNAKVNKRSQDIKGEDT